MSDFEIPKVEHDLDGWKREVEEDLRITPGLIRVLEDGKAMDIFQYNWFLVGQVMICNESITQYLDRKLIEECRELCRRYDQLIERHHPRNVLTQIGGLTIPYEDLPDSIQDEVSEETMPQQYDDPELLALYRSKLELERRILKCLYDIE